MFNKLMNCLRKNTWLLVAAFLAFAASAFVGSLTVDSGTTTPVVWLAAMWAMLAVGAVVIVGVVVECALALVGGGD